MAECTGQEPEPTPVPETEPEPKQEPAGLNPAMLLVVLAVLGSIGALVYFKFIKQKPKTKGSDNLDDYDYGEDDKMCIRDRVEIQRGLTTSSTAIFVPFTTQELFQNGKEALYYGCLLYTSRCV